MESSAQVGPQPAGAQRLVQARGHAGLQEAGDQDLVEVGVLDAHRGAVAAAQPAPVDHRVALADAERAGHAGAGLLAPGQQRLGLDEQVAPRHLLAERGDAARRTTRARHEGAATRDPLQQPLDHQRVHRLPHGHPGHAEPVHELALGGRGRAGRGARDEGAHVLAHLDVLERTSLRHQQFVHARTLGCPDVSRPGIAGLTSPISGLPSPVRAPARPRSSVGRDRPQHVQPRGPPRGEDRGQHAHHQRERRGRPRAAAPGR